MSYFNCQVLILMLHARTMSNSGKFTLSPEIFGCSGSWSGLEGWIQLDSLVGAVVGYAVDNFGLQLSAWRQRGEVKLCSYEKGLLTTV